MPIQGHAALVVSIIAVVIVLITLWIATQAEKDRPVDQDDH